MINEIFTSERRNLNLLKRQDIPKEKGIYGYFNKDSQDLEYIGSAVSCEGLRGRIWSQHLNVKYLENREDRFSKKDKKQIEKEVKKNGKIVIEKSAFRKNLARKHDLIPGEPCLQFLKENFDIVIMSLGELSKEKIHEIEKKIIIEHTPRYNIRKF